MCRWCRRTLPLIFVSYSERQMCFPEYVHPSRRSCPYVDLLGVWFTFIDFGAKKSAPGVWRVTRHSGFFFFITLEPRVEWYTSLWALNTSPPRYRFTFRPGSCSWIENSGFRTTSSGKLVAFFQNLVTEITTQLVHTSNSKAFVC